VALPGAGRFGKIGNGHIPAGGCRGLPLVFERLIRHLAESKGLCQEERFPAF
jgi:hypothetical protein